MASLFSRFESVLAENKENIFVQRTSATEANVLTTLSLMMKHNCLKIFLLGAVVLVVAAVVETRYVRKVPEIAPRSVNG